MSPKKTRNRDPEMRINVGDICAQDHRVPWDHDPRCPLHICRAGKVECPRTRIGAGR